MNEQIIFSIFVFIIGSCFGSFLSVLIHRTLSKSKGIIKGKSRCPKCRHNLKALDLIPILSWISKKGKCSYCQKKISPLYPTIELITGLLFFANLSLLISSQGAVEWTIYQNNLEFWLKFIYFNLLSLNLLAICFSDLKTKTIPNIFLYSWVILSIPGILLNGGNIYDNVINHLLALTIALAFFGGQYAASKGRWLGSGDIYLSAGMALLLGLNNFILASVFSYFIGSFIVITLMLAKRAHSKQTVPFAPFLVMGTFVAFYHGNEIINWYFSNFLSLNFF